MAIVATLAIIVLLTSYLTYLAVGFILGLPIAAMWCVWSPSGVSIGLYSAKQGLSGLPVVLKVGTTGRVS